MNSRILYSEIIWSFSRSSGPGGQNVNKVETKAEGRFCIKHSNSLSNSEKELLRSWITHHKPSLYSVEADSIRISDQSTRSQEMNKTKVFGKYKDMLARALTPPKKRIPTKPTHSSKRKRIETKKKRSETKKARGKVEW